MLSLLRTDHGPGGGTDGHGCSEWLQTRGKSKTTLGTALCEWEGSGGGFRGGVVSVDLRLGGGVGNVRGQGGGLRGGVVSVDLRLGGRGR